MHNFIYHNFSCRPKGVHLTIKDYLQKNTESGKLYYEVYPETISELDIPDSLLKVSSKYLTYYPTITESAKYILKIKNGRILADYFYTTAIFDADDKIIGDVSLDLHLKNGQTLKDSTIFKRKYYPKIDYYKGTVFHTIAGGGSYVNYFHWLIDSISKIHILKKSGLFNEVDWFYVPTTEYDYHIDSLRALGITEHQIIDGRIHPHIKADVLLAPSYSRGKHRHIPQWIVDFFACDFTPRKEPKYKTRKFFISRKDANTRRIVNEDEVSSFLAQYNVETVILSRLTFQEKIDLFANAQLIISLGTAGFTNILFCKGQTTVLELSGDQFVDFRFYYDIAMKKKLDYHYLIGKNINKSDDISSGMYNDVKIEIGPLKQMMEDELNLVPITLQEEYITN
ncbi:glycosyltransferase family 61 protein [Draconibacterium aestuarii]